MSALVDFNPSLLLGDTIISEEEANGGFVPIVKAGLVFDTRDKGINV